MTLLEQAQDYVYRLFKDKLSDSFLYHNFNHTLSVVNAVTTIADAESIIGQDRELLLLAAWFHDTGYVNGCERHEESSVVIVTEFLKSHDYPQEYIEQVASLIRATVKSFVPTTELEKIIRDADYFHLASKDYLLSATYLKMELKNTMNLEFTELEWAKENLKFLEQHHSFYSSYAQENWQLQKEKNSKRLRKRIQQLEQPDMVQSTKKVKQKEKETPDRSIDTMFKITLTNHIRLSEIADSKANILLSVNAIIISIALSTIIPKLDSPGNVHLIVPTFIMVLFSVISIIFAILSTKPKVTSGQFTRKDIEDKKVNLLFFGNFYKMPYEEYQWAVNELLNDRAYLHNSMTKDLYYLGLVLARKYRLLRFTYTIFMVGIVVSVLAFVYAFRNVPL
ncbi:Pycsar system effector family protein [Flavobacterium sp.]|uniref:Pycsar system effector family protein n=1 Tax=Flavobacterium sp. TaxID=239 RepID=UPI002B4B33E3|nr:Pycsar system effector family protein [Flavobacterium sp.]HLP64708.1 Pycsar system effector family protein [Flavobacterium sp.]